MKRSASIAFPLFPLAALAFASIACQERPGELVGKDPSQQAATPGSTNGDPPASPTSTNGAPADQAAVKGPIDLATALDGVTGKGALLADLETESGRVSCKLLEDKAPIAVANFVGLARGLQPFRDPSTGTWVKRRAYDGTTFHRIVKGFMVQGGDPTGTGHGSPGYTFADEVWPGAKHDRAGLLCMANTGPNRNGMQFFVTDDAAPHLDVSYTIFGECTPTGTIHKLAATPVGPDGETPVVKPKILSVKIHREKDK